MPFQRPNDTIPRLMQTSESWRRSHSGVTTDKGPPVISIVVPAFNEAERIGNSIRKINAFIRQSQLSFECIIVDDGSADDTAEIVKQSQVEGLRLVQNGRNRGKGYTVRQGVLAASGKYVLFTDADLSAPIEELDKLLDVAVKEGVDIVIGSRAVDRKYIEKKQSPFPELGGKGFNLMVRPILGLQLHDTHCGL